MKTLKIGKKDLDGDNFYKKDSLNFDGHVEIAGGLGYFKVKKSIIVTGFLQAQAGSGIKAGDGIKAGWGIITFFGDIVAKFVSCLRICVGFNSTTTYEIQAEIRKGDIMLGKHVIPKKEK
jgi:hypothetical protein